VKWSFFTLRKIEISKLEKFHGLPPPSGDSMKSRAEVRVRSQASHANITVLSHLNKNRFQIISLARSLTSDILCTGLDLALKVKEKYKVKIFKTAILPHNMKV